MKTTDELKQDLDIIDRRIKLNEEIRNKELVELLELERLKLKVLLDNSINGEIISL